MANAKQLALLRKSVARWNAWRERNLDVVIDLTRADLIRANLGRANLCAAGLIGADLRGANLVGANLTDANLTDATLSHADLRQADLRMTDLRNAYLVAADLSGVNLSDAELGGADLTGANLTFAKLSGADFKRAKFGATVLVYTDLSKVKGLETLYHLLPSTIGLDTIDNSRGNIPDIFLRGCGVPDNIIENMHSLVGKPYEFYKCFISHSSKDMAFCTRLYNDLQGSGVRCWFFPEDAKWGEKVWGEIDRTIRVYDKLVVVCSKHSLQSGPVMREIERALQREDREGKNILFPITLDRYVFDEWEHHLRSDVVKRVVGSFQGWNRSAAKYDGAFTKLLAALPAPASATVVSVA